MNAGNDILFPFEVVEILNGILFPTLFWMLLFLVMHLCDAWRNTRIKYMGRGGFLRTVKSMHSNYKPEIALFTIVSAFCIRTFILWYVRWIKNNEIDWSDAVTDHSGEILMATTSIIIIGVACWVRVISPLSGRIGALAWALMVTTSLTFGVVMHYAF